MKARVYVYKKSKDTPPHVKKKFGNSKMNTPETKLTSLN